jgi:hypothetical protein
MTEPELRSLVREAIARELSREGGPIPPVVSGASGHAGMAAAMPPLAMPGQHASHAMFVLPIGSEGDGACVIEPAVACTHCGFCKSYGH